MDTTIFETEDGTRVVFVPPKNPEFEALEIGEVDRRIRAAIPALDGQLYDLLAKVVMMSVPPPAALANFLRDAVSALDGALDFIHDTMPNKQSFWLWRQLGNDTFDFIGQLQSVRDRMYRVCEHNIEVSDNGDRRCRDCKNQWGPGEGKPGRILMPRAYSPLAEGQQRPGKAAFIYLAAEVTRRHGQTKVKALRLARRLLELFWIDGGGSYADDTQLESAHRQGKESAARNRFISADDLLHYRHFPGLASALIWVPYAKPHTPNEAPE